MGPAFVYDKGYDMSSVRIRRDWKGQSRLGGSGLDYEAAY
jgi:hypothetical protein